MHGVRWCAVPASRAAHRRTPSGTGEACAVSWRDVDLDAGTVTVTGTVLRVKGQGFSVSRPKSAAGERVLEPRGAQAGSLQL